MPLQYVKREDVILMSGCGNSRLTEDMFEDGQWTCTYPIVIITHL